MIDRELGNNSYLSMHKIDSRRVLHVSILDWMNFYYQEIVY